MRRMRLAPDDDFTLELELDELASVDQPGVLAGKLAARIGGSPAELPPLEIRKRSLDARHGRVRFHLVVGAAGSAPLGGAAVRAGSGPPVVIVGGGPAGLFCAYELARAQIAWQLGKRYVQDSELDWGVARMRESTDAEARIIASPREEKTKAGS